MASEGGKDPVAVEQQEENIDSASNDRPDGNESQTTFDQPSSSTTALSSEIATDNSKTQLNSNEEILSVNDGLLSCPECNNQVHPKKHKFCSGCGKTIQEIVSTLFKKQGKSSVLICPKCKTELDINKDKFCYNCGEKVSDIDKSQDPSHSHTRACLPVSGGPENVSDNGPNVARIDEDKKEKADLVMEIAETGVQDSPQPSSASDETTFQENKTAQEEMPNDENVGSISDPQPNTSVIVVAAEIVETNEDVVPETHFVGAVSNDRVDLEELQAAKRMKFSDEKPPQEPENKKASENGPRTRACLPVSGGPENVSDNGPNVARIDEDKKERADPVMEIAETGVQDSPQPSSASDETTFQENKTAQEEMPNDENVGSISDPQPNTSVIVVATEIVETKEDVVQQAHFVGAVSDDRVVLEELQAAKRIKFSDEKPAQEPENKKASENGPRTRACLPVSGGPENVSDNGPNVAKIDEDKKGKADPVMEIAETGVQDSPQPSSASDETPFEENNAAQEEIPSDENGGNISNPQPNTSVIVVATEIVETKEDVIQQALYVGTVSNDRVVLEELQATKRLKFSDEKPPQEPENKKANENGPRTQGGEANNNSDSVWRGEDTEVNENAESSENRQQTTQKPALNNENEAKDGNIQATQGEEPNSKSADSRASGEENRDDKNMSDNVDKENSGNPRRTTKEPVLNKKNETKDGNMQTTQGEGPNNNPATSRTSGEENKDGKKANESANTESSGNRQKTTQEPVPNTKNETKDGNMQPTQGERPNNNLAASHASGEEKKDVSVNESKNVSENDGTESSLKRKQTTQEPVTSKKNKKDGNILPIQGEGPNNNSAASRGSDDKNKTEKNVSENVDPESPGNRTKTTHEPEPNKKNETKDGNIKPKHVEESNRNSAASRAGGEENEAGKKARGNVTTESSEKPQEAPQQPVLNKGNEGGGVNKRITRSATQEQRSGAENGVSPKKTLLSLTQTSSDPLSGGNGSDAAGRVEDGGNEGDNPPGYFYKKKDVKDLDEPKGKDKKKGKNANKNATSTDTEKTLTVVFHAIISDKFKLDDSKQIVIRGEEPVFGGWNKGGIPVKTEEYIDKQLLAYAEFSVPMRLASHRCGYKYVILNKKDKPTYEWIVEYQSSWGYTIINRCLVIEEKHILENDILHKYDGFVYPKQGMWSWDRFFSSGSPMSDRREFFHKFFPKWSGFHVEPCNDAIGPVEALKHLDALVEGISALNTESSSGHVYRYAVDKYRLKLGEVFEAILMPKLLENLKVMESEAHDAKVHAVVSSIVIAYVFTKHKVNLKAEKSEILLKCLRLPPEEKVCSEFVEIVNQFDQEILRSFNNVILEFYQQLARKPSLVVNWLPALPVLHFLRNESKPFEEVVCEKPANDGKWKWWGLAELPIREIRKNIDESAAFAMLPGLKDMFNMDQLLRRTYLVLCRVEMFESLLKTTNCFSCLDLCVTMRTLLLETKTSHSFIPDFVKYLETFFTGINEALLSMSPKQFPEGRLKETLVLLDNLVFLVQNIRQHLKFNEIGVLCRLVECLTTTIVLQKKGIDYEDEPNAQPDPSEKLSISCKLADIPSKMLYHFNEQCGYVEYFIRSNLRELEYSNDRAWDEELQAWNEVLSLSVLDIFYESWNKKFLSQFQSRVLKVKPERQIDLFCLSDEQKCHDDITTCLSEAAFKALEKIVEAGHGEQPVFDRLAKSKSSRAISLLSRMLQKAWPKQLQEESQLPDKERDEVLLNHLLTWSCWPGFLNFFGKMSSSRNEFIKVENCEIMMTMAESCLDTLINSVENGTVTVQAFRLVEENVKQFLKLAEIHRKNQNGRRPSEMSTEAYFKQRLSERDAFYTLRDQLECFVVFSGVFLKVDEELDVLRDKIGQDYNEKPIHDLCRKRTGGGYDVLFFNLDERFHKMVSKITDIKSSLIFKTLWEKHGGELNDEIVKMEIIFENIWLPICKKISEINKEFLDGEMELKKVDEYLNICKNYDAMELEFILISRHFNETANLEKVKKKLKIIMGKVKSYKKLFDARQAAEAIMQLQNRMGLKGDFSEVKWIEEIISQNFKGKTINSLSNDLLETGKLLEEVTPDRQGCLRTFTNCHNLVTWLRESIKDEQELKVFVDLAMISAGEDDMEIDKISCMHTSCLGFGPLIFGYKEHHGFHHLMRLCRLVWQAVDANPDIKGKLNATRANLSWLKQIKESHGSVALTTMLQVEAINSCGIYFIADSELRVKDSKHVKKEGRLCLENLVYLVVPTDEEKNREEKIYSLEEIKDVQSKLMLIAGKADSGKEDVDQFNQVFEGILRLSSLYLQLCEVGEIDYMTWKRKFQCSKKEGRREKLLNDINECCEQMEGDLKKWRETIDGKRRECYSLNHFTMKQILNLRKELAKTCTGKIAIDELPLQTFMLLETVNKDVNPILLADVLKDLIAENSIFMTENGFTDEQKYFEDDQIFEEFLGENIFEEDLEEPLEEDVHSISPNTQRRKNSIESFNTAKDTLESMGKSEEYAVAAVQNCGRHATEDQLVAWVFSDECDEENVAELCEQAKANPHLSDILKDVFEPECDAEESDEEMILNTTTVYNRETKERKAVSKCDKPYVHNEKDTYLTLDVLTAILETLSGSETRLIERKLPSMLKEGEPNLLLVPKAEVFGCVLSLFMATAHQPLPTDEEVIVCDENTTAEELELLWRRAIVDASGLLFCLVNADLLDYDVSQQALRSLDTLTQGYAKYHLVVICSSENEDKSNMVASLDQYRRKFPPVTSMKGIQRYLKEKLVVSQGKMIGDTKWEPAGVVDPEKLSVRVVQSSRAGMGKSLIVKHQAEQLKNLPSNKKLRKDLIPSLCPTVPVHGISVDSDHVTKTLLSHAVKRDIPVSRIFHLDMSQSIVKGLDNFLFKLVILRSVKDHDGNVWRRKPTDMYVIEITTDKSFETLIAEDANFDGSYNQNSRKQVATNKYSFVKFLPRTHCLTPRETLKTIEEHRRGDTGFDMEKFQSEEYQRTFQYLTQFATGANLDKFAFIYDPRISIGDPVDALKIIIRYCGIRDPSWAELHHFVNFLNIQLRDCEESVFCDAALVGDLLQGFRTFAVRFMIQMSRDFATRSLSDSNLGGEDESAEEENDDLAPFKIRRRWELSPHPYIFFNHDRNSMTFLGFRLSQNGDLLDPSTNAVLERKLMDPTLRGQLILQGVNFDVNYEQRNRLERIVDLCSVMGIEFVHDPDKSYELTTDNVEKILAIHMRFRCGIPVIIMGETGCGKTRLIKFMCELQAGPDGPKNLLLMKVHGGTSYAEIEKKVEEAEKLASFNEKIHVDTILFFDEANTTDAIDLIKEIMVDRRVNGRAIDPKLTRLHFIAACNPYRKHTKEMIKKLESAGLGYHVSADETEDKLGSIPLRQLVYRVHPLPESMRPLVWDFGQLTDHTEELYTAQIVRRFMAPIPAPRRTLIMAAKTSIHETLLSKEPAACVAEVLPVSKKRTLDQERAPVVAGTSSIRRTLCNSAQAACIAKVLSASQKYMREEKNECSFVSLRDVERAMKVILWFHSNSELISRVIDGQDSEEYDDSDEESSDEESDRIYDEDEDDLPRVRPRVRPRAQVTQTLSEIVRALILGIGVCYYARLNDRTPYCEYICQYFDGSCPLPGGVKRMQNEIVRCQRGFLSDIQLGQNIARNIALSENVFMMAICTELRIPLFVVGKPGSSKSLAKDVISTNMKAGNSQSELFKNLKQIHMQSYQCSPLSTPEGIVSTFRQCAKLQKDKDLNKFVSVVVLDEIGLAEDSPLMPLKTLHPLLEDGTATTEESEKPSVHKGVGFIGLSNWALDPAKMNRGIMLSRGVPGKDELLDSARGICSSDEAVQRRLDLRKLCDGYFDLYKKQSKSKTLQVAQKDEFFGLRDFYSLIKMVYGFAEQTEEGDQINERELEQSIRRNFSGLDDLDPVKIFARQFEKLKRFVKNPSPECHPVKLIQNSLGKTEKEGESRYLLVLTENYAALRLLQSKFHRDHDPVVIFGSSFPKDQQYTQICRNINRIKVCMETGRMVILLNLESLYESLYDALNQYYVYLDKQKYVDLGLGNHRVKCRVAEKFKLIVVAEKDVVYKRFPIPLINRLEKHLLVMSTGLDERQTRLVKELEKWVQDFSKATSADSSSTSSFKPGDCFVGYHSDTAAAVVIQISDLNNGWSNEEILVRSKRTILQCASPDAIARLPATKLKHEAENLWDEYFNKQKHGSLKDYLVHCLRKDTDSVKDGCLIQITTHSRLLSKANSRSIASAAGFRNQESRCISLQEFNTEQQFIKTLEEFITGLGGAEGLLLIQCDNGERNFNLIACCRYLVGDTRRRTLEDFRALEESVKPVHVIFVIQLPKIAGGCQHFVGFQGGMWQSVHIDELLESNEQLPQIEQLVNRSVSDLFQTTDFARRGNIEEMDVDRRCDDIQEMDVDANLTREESGLLAPNPEENERMQMNEQLSEHRIQPTSLLKNCLQAAAARIYDESAEIDRATKRIEVLLKWLPEDDSCETELSRVLIARVQKLLLERDEKCFDDQRLWLQHEALSQGHLQETGTFRKALWQKLSSIVSPILSEVIAFCDRNHNLDLLCKEKDWKLQLWFTMLAEERITPLSYDSFISPVSRRVRERARVSSSGAGHRFNGKFPFSWIIKDMVNVLLLQVGALSAENMRSLRGVFHSSPLGKILQPTFEDEIVKNEAVMNYLNDFLHMTYKPIVEGEMQLICDAVLGAAAQIHLSFSEDEEFELDIPLIHVAYSAIQARLVNFSELVQAFPNLVGNILKLRKRLDVGEMILDAVALECCLQILEPSRNDLENAHNRLIWCNRVQTIRPIIQVMKSLILEPVQEQQNVQLPGTKSAHILNNCRAVWIRLDVVRMFIEHTCPPGQSTHSADAQNALELWKALGDHPNFSSVQTMTTIERFLKSCSNRLKDRVINFDISQCTICQNPLQDPVEFPCRHISCFSCANSWFADHDTCPLCRHQVAENFEVRISKRCRRALLTYNSFRNRCKSFFMELVSMYCFGEQLPHPDLVRKFIGYVIKDENRTEDFSPFDGQGIDITPVLRSYILQQLLSIKEREKEVYQHLQEYLNRARRLSERKEDMTEVCVLCLHCIEDVESVKLLTAKEGGDNVQIICANRTLERTLRTLSSMTKIDINCLKDIAGIRAALDAFSTYLGDTFAENLGRFEALPKCLDTAKRLCSHQSRSVVQLFLLKQLVRHDANGIDAVKERCKRRELKWILPPQSEEQDKTPDTFIVHHENYHIVREGLGKAKLTSNIDQLNSVINDIRTQPSARSCYVLLALFREITTSLPRTNREDRIPRRVMDKLTEYTERIQYLSNDQKALARNLLTNFGNANVRLLHLAPQQSVKDRRLHEVLIHFLVVIRCLPRDQLLQPLINLALNPALMLNAFIPTMPHDDGPEVMQATTGRWYECPRGHRYVITECGNPNQAYNCPECGLAIGGAGILAANNRDASRQDRSTTGHILRDARAQPQTVTSERNLTPLSCGVLRCLTHVAMLLGTDQNTQSIAAIIKPPVQDVVQFLREHIHHDIRCIARSTSNSDDEAVQIIHLILVGIINRPGQQAGNVIVDGNLATKGSRTTWENLFTNAYLNPVLSNVTQLLQDSLGRMVRDERLGNNRLMRLIHELDEPNYDTVTRIDPMCPALWRCRKKITIDSLSVKFQEYSQAQDKQDKCEVLAEFLKKEHHLRALQYFPDIVKLQRLLFEKFHRRLDRNEAEKYKLADYLKRDPAMKEQFKILVNSFRSAWKIVRSSLSEDGPFGISQEMRSSEIKMSTPISMFLPADTGLGRCALALNNFLISLHNDFVGRCKSLLNDESRSTVVPLANVTKAHLVAYDPDKDFLPMIFANCDYSLKVGEGTVVEFNWKSLERQLVDRFIRGRPRLTSLVELFVFSKDICDGEVFTALKQKIPQVELTRPIQDQILSELNQLTDVCDVLKSLHIAIGFLSSAGGDPSMSLHDYLHSGLRMTLKNGLKSGKAEHFCQLQHIVSLWLLLSLERATVLTKHKQDPFDDVSENLKSSLTQQQNFYLNNGLQKINVDHFVRVLLEYILLQLKHGPEEQLHWPLSEYINTKLEAEEREPFDGLEEYIPEDITVRHAVEAWKVACQKSEDYHSRMQ